MPKRNRPELLIPASSLEVLKTAVIFGADAVYIGDSDIDVATARNAGLSMITVLWGFRDKPQLIEAGAERFAENMDDVKRMLGVG